MAVALSAICSFLGLKFIPVIDPNINKNYEKLLKHFSYQVVKIGTLDKNNGYLLSKLEYVKNYCEYNDNVFWTNQYENCDNYKAHYNGTGLEIAKEFDHIDYAFIAVASCGTISGVSNRLKEEYPNIKIIAVDVEGSVIFGKEAAPRHIPGMGSGIQPKLVNDALIDEVVYVNELETIDGCNELFSEHCIFSGGSTGTVYSAINKYFLNKSYDKKPNVVFISPDKGTAYVDNIYNSEWLEKFFNNKLNIKDEVKCYI